MGKKRGRPTKYKKEFCEKLIEHMSQGYSFESFAAVIDVDEETLRTWVGLHPDFLGAKGIAFTKSRQVWEKILIGGTTGKIKNYNATSAIFALKNRFPKEWRDRREIEIEGNNVITSPQIQVIIPSNGREKKDD